MIPRDISGKALSLWRQYPLLTIGNTLQFTFFREIPR